MKKRNLPEYAITIRTIRLRLGLTQKGFAKRIKATLYKVTGWETGAISPTVDEYEAIKKLDRKKGAV